MRDIKFRAWDKENEWWCTGRELEEEGLIGRCDGDPLCLELDPHDNIIYEQFTGLKDKNGREIYEGDIIKVIWEPYEPEDDIDEVSTVHTVEWMGYKPWSYPAFDVTPSVSDDTNGLSYIFECCDIDGPRGVEVIGNIHENPELLEGEL